MHDIFKHIAAFSTGEWMLKMGGERNGSVFILLRAMWTGALAALCGLSLREILELVGVKVGLGNFLKAWLGLLGAVYLSYYARFASQWSYVSGLYNQIKEFECANAKSIYAQPVDPQMRQEFLDWKCDFIMDAWDLHLIGKRAFAAITRIWVEKHGNELYHQFVEVTGHTQKEWAGVLKLVSRNQKELESLQRKGQQPGSRAPVPPITNGKSEQPPALD